MSEPRVIRADFANWRPVAGRKVLQLIFEVPIEQTKHTMDMLGVPVSGESRWCAIALLNEGLAPQAGTLGDTSSRVVDGSIPSGVASSSSERSEAALPKTPFHDLPIVQQCAIRCADKQFQDYMCNVFWNTNVDEPTEEYTALLVRNHCGIESRKELGTNSAAASRWHDLEAQYRAHLTTLQYEDMRK